MNLGWAVWHSAVLVMFCLQPDEFRNRQLRPLPAQLLGLPAAKISAGRMSYDLRRLRLHGIIARIPQTQRYRLTTFGLKPALFYSRVYQRLLRPGLSQLLDPRTEDSAPLPAAFRKLQKIIDAHVTEKNVA